MHTEKFTCNAANQNMLRLGNGIALKEFSIKTCRSLPLPCI